MRMTMWNEKRGERWEWVRSESMMMMMMREKASQYPYNQGMWYQNFLSCYFQLWFLFKQHHNTRVNFLWLVGFLLFFGIEREMRLTWWRTTIYMRVDWEGENREIKLYFFYIFGCWWWWEKNFEFKLVHTVVASSAMSMLNPKKKEVKARIKYTKIFQKKYELNQKNIFRCEDKRNKIWKQLARSILCELERKWKGVGWYIEGGWNDETFWNSQF